MRKLKKNVEEIIENLFGDSVVNFNYGPSLIIKVESKDGGFEEFSLTYLFGDVCAIRNFKFTTTRMVELVTIINNNLCNKDNWEEVE